MRGITETELWMHRNNDMLDWDNRRAFDIVMRICPPKELNPWLPIDENTPKAKPILLRVNGFAITGIGEYGMYNSWIDIVTRQLVIPTHYQELPADPE